MRKLITYLTALFLAASCMAELEPGGTATGDSLEGAPVMITFSVPDIPLLPATKSLEEGDGDITDTPYLDPEKMYVVVCGGSQSIKYIRKATYLEPVPNYTVPDYPSSDGNHTVTLYKFKVQLELSDFPRTIHIMGNVDENQLITGSYSYNSLPNLLSYENKQAYWQELHVPYIKAGTDPSTQKPIMNQDGSYAPDAETTGFFQNIPLIRNYAKIQVTNAAEKFHLHSYAVIFYPERGSVVPFRSNEPVKENRFDFNPPESYRFSGYEKSTFTQLESSINYLGNMPSSVALSKYIPRESEFRTPSSSGGKVLLYDEDDEESGFYVYERGIPTDKIGPTFIIICGKFDEDDNWYYYRLDLMETKDEGNQTISKYYPIYRNFRYNIQIHRISSEGVLTPEAAANSSGVEDISADISMRHLSDISNGTTRLVVEPFMTRTYSGPAKAGEYYELYARFFNDVTSDEPNMNTVAVRVELEPMEDGSDDILILYDNNGTRVPKGSYFFPIAAQDMGGVEGIRTIRFNTVEPLDETKTQKIKITGHNPGTNQDLRLYREVEITLQKKQPLTVTCTNPVSTSAGSSVTVDITIPSELPESMFPVEFIVEPEAGTLTPDTSKNVNMPVVSGSSIADSAFKGHPTFYYIRTLTWEEFMELPVSKSQRTLHCFFKTNRDFNATTVWVYNEYFDKGSDSFKNMLPLNLACDPVLADIDKPINLAISIHSQIPFSFFPLDFIVEPEMLTMTPRDNDLKGYTGPSIATNATTYKDTDATQFKKRLTWEEYLSLPVVGNERTFYCHFMSTVASSATTFWVYNENFFKANVSFQNVETEPDNHFWVKAIGDEGCTIFIRNSNIKGIKYKIDNGDDWTDYTAAGIILTKDQKASIKAGSNASKKTWSAGSASISGTGGSFIIGGNFTSLVVGDDYPKFGASLNNYTFVDFFKSQTGLVDAYDLILPITEPAANAYKSMFDSCTKLVRGPRILPATTLNNFCYRNMFYGCTSLKYAPELPATSLVTGCYQRMFWGCTNLSHIKMLGTSWIPNVFVSDNTTWCAGVAAEGVIDLNAAIKDDISWKSIIPSGWEVNWVTVAQ